MAAKKAKAGNKKKKKAAQNDSIERLVRLQQRAVDRWSKYTTDAARLTTEGSMSPQSWMAVYAKLTRGALDDLGEFVRVISHIASVGR